MTTEQRGLALIHHIRSQFENIGLSIAHGVALVKRKMPVKVLLANDSDSRQSLLENQIIGQVFPHSSSLFSTNVDVTDAVVMFSRKNVEGSMNLFPEITNSSTPPEIGAERLPTKNEVPVGPPKVRDTVHSRLGDFHKSDSLVEALLSLCSATVNGLVRQPIKLAIILCIRSLVCSPCFERSILLVVVVYQLEKSLSISLVYHGFIREAS